MSSEVSTLVILLLNLLLDKDDDIDVDVDVDIDAVVDNVDCLPFTSLLILLVVDVEEKPVTTGPGPENVLIDAVIAKTTSSDGNDEKIRTMMSRL